MRRTLVTALIAIVALLALAPARPALAAYPQPGSRNSRTTVDANGSQV